MALPILQPVGFKVVDDYKVQLSMDGERLLTPWLLIIGRRAAQPPYVEVELLRSGDTIKSVSAKVRRSCRGTGLPLPTTCPCWGLPSKCLQGVATLLR